jgi:hypothetical protein
MITALKNFVKDFATRYTQLFRFPSIGNSLHTGPMTTMSKAVKCNCKLVGKGNLLVLGVVVGKHRIRCKFGEDLAKGIWGYSQTLAKFVRTSWL